MNQILQTTRPAQKAALTRSPATRPLRIKLYLLLMATDVLCVVGAFVAGALIRHGHIGVEGWAGVTASVVALYALTAASFGAYSLDVLRHPSQGTGRTAASVLLSFAMLFLISYFLKIDQEISRIITGTSLLLALISISLVRQLLGDALKRALRGRFTTEILISDGAPAGDSDALLRVDAAEIGLRPDVRDATMLIKFTEMLQGVDRVVVSCSRSNCVRWAQMLKATNIQGEILSREYDHLAPLGISHLDEQTTLVVSSGPFPIRHRIAKRAFDLALTVPSLFLLAPVLALIALAIKIDSSGPVLFAQRRVGRGNALFKIYKFRTMTVDQADFDGHVSTSREDARVTRIGRLLRRTSLDELPQLINVLLGSMSIVGPRPHALGSLAGTDLFWHVDERYWHRHALKPGITGLAQVRGFRGATHTREDLTSRLQADLEYIAGWSLLRDISIVARTVSVLVHPQAY